MTGSFRLRPSLQLFPLTKMFRGGIVGLSFSPDGLFLATGGENFIQCHDTFTWGLTHRIGPHALLNCFSLSPLHRYLATGGRNYKLTVWDFMEPEEIWSAEMGCEVEAVAFSSDGETLASAGRFDAVLWNTRTGARLQEVPGIAGGGLGRVAFSSTRLACSGSRRITLLGLTNGSIDGYLDGHEDSVDAVAFSPDGSSLASGDRSGVVYVWDLKTGSQCPLKGHEGGICSLVFSRNGKILVSGGRDGNVVIWDLSERKVARRLEPHEGWVQALAFSPGGEWLVTGGGKKVAIWESTKLSDR